MGQNGGARPGAGRPPGAKDKLALENIERAREFGDLPHEFLAKLAAGVPMPHKVLVDGKVVETMHYATMEERRDAAKAAAPYYAPKLSSIEVIKDMSDEALYASIVGLAAAAGFSLGALGVEQAANRLQGGTRERRSARTRPDQLVIDNDTGRAT